MEVETRAALRVRRLCTDLLVWTWPPYWICRALARMRVRRERRSARQPTAARDRRRKAGPEKRALSRLRTHRPSSPNLEDLTTFRRAARRKKEDRRKRWGI
eukprot:5041052-Pleurochrysis_carterae.AAC.1